MTLFGALFGTGAAVFTCAAAGYWSGRLKAHQLNGFIALANFVFVIAGVVDRSTVGPAINTASGAVSAYLWWKGGGGDDTKRRLRKLRRSFTGSRRTAPSAA
jgi:FtsH-binding integral membrane protein